MGKCEGCEGFDSACEYSSDNAQQSLMFKSHINKNQQPKEVFIGETRGKREIHEWGNNRKIVENGCKTKKKRII